MFKNKTILWVENYLLRPSPPQRLISFLLLPFSFLYCFFTFLKRYFAKPEDFNIPIISVGNLTVGGSGKTPFILSLAKDYDKVAIILRGYKRESSGLKVVSEFGKIKENIKTSGDEAMLYAKSLKNAHVIVSEDRKVAIKKAKKMGAKVIFLDDGFSKSNIKKFDILLYPNPKPKNTFCLPSGGFRESKKSEKYADLILHEDKDFTKKTYITNESENMVLVTAIANASRLDKFLPPHIKDKFIFPDHHAFSFHELKNIIKQTNASSLLVTRKDWVKIEEFGLNLSILELELEISPHVRASVKNYLTNF